MQKIRRKPNADHRVCFLPNFIIFMGAAIFIWTCIFFSLNIHLLHLPWHWALETLVSVKPLPQLHTTPIPSFSPSLPPSQSQETSFRAKVPPRPPNPGYCSHLFPDILDTVKVGPVALHNLGGDFGHEEMITFMRKISEQLKPVESEGTLCDVYFRGDAHYRTKPQNGGKGCHKVWFVMNGEESRSEVLHKATKRHMKFFHDFIYVGNWWARWSENYTNDEVTSFWLPYVSTNFVSHDAFTPMDLFHRKSMINDSRKIIAYQHRNCDSHREAFWDTINDLLIANFGSPGIALSKCNGNKDLGERMEFDKVTSNHFDDTIYSYSHFEFSLNMEHNDNDIGYITEKIVDGFLASAVPIYRGAKQINQIFIPESFLVENNAGSQMLDLLNNKKELRRLQTDPVITEESMKRFFSWHPSVWPHFGDAMRADIWSAIAKHCELSVEQIYHKT